jgi:predicted dehydrogenase
VNEGMSRRRALRVAVIGQGFMGRAHGFGWARAAALEGSRLTPELAVLCGRDRAALAGHAELYGFASWSDDWAEVVGRDDVDLVDICTPGAAHAEMALAALAAGKHVLCEKPLANSLVDARHMAGAAQQAAAKGVFAMVGFNNRRVAAVAAARALIAEGRIGALRHVRAVYLQGWLVDPLFPLTWRLDGAEAGSGALGDLLSHVVDLVRYLTGEEVDEVVSMLETFVRQRPLGSSGAGLSATADQEGRTGPVTVDDACAVLARLSGGALATLEATRMAPGSNNALAVELNGSRGSLRFDLERLNELELYERTSPVDGFSRTLVTSPGDPYAGQWWPPGHVLGWEHSFVHEFQDFMAAIADGRQPEPSFLDGYLTQAVLDAVSRSAASRNWTAVDRAPIFDTTFSGE